MALNYVNGPSDGVSTDNALVRWDGATGRLVQNSVNGPFASDAGLLGLATSAPTHSLTLSSTATGAVFYNTSDQTTNYERLRVSWAANVIELVTEAGGTGSTRAVRIGTPVNQLLFSATTGTFTFSGAASNYTMLAAGSSAGMRIRGNIGAAGVGLAFVELSNAATYTASSGTQVGAQVVMTVNQTGTAGYKGFIVNVTETGIGSGTQDLLSLEIAGTQRARIGHNGNVYASMQTAIPAGGAANTGYYFSSTAGFGIYYGSGAPSVSAAKGSLYLRSDGSGTGDRAYINTDGGTTWTALTTAA